MDKIEQLLSLNNTDIVWYNNDVWSIRETFKNVNDSSTMHHIINSKGEMLLVKGDKLKKKLTSQGETLIREYLLDVVDRAHFVYTKIDISHELSLDLDEMLGK